MGYSDRDPATLEAHAKKPLHWKCNEANLEMDELTGICV